MDIVNIYNQLKELGGDSVKWLASDLGMLFSLSTDQQQTLKTLLIKDSFSFHYENNSFYRGQCDEKGVTPDDIQSFSDLIKIPVIPVHTFKSADSHKLLTKPLNEIEHEMRSTGTSGIPSVARRCSETMDNAVIGIYAMYREMFNLSKGAGLCVCPSTEEIPEMGMVKAFNFLTGLLDTHRFMVKNERFSPEDSIEQLSQWKNKFTRHLIGPPFLIHRLTSYLKAINQPLQLDKDSMIITLGGWKRFTGQMISRREFNAEVETYLGVPATNIRDMYGLVEASMLAIENEFNQKIIPPYVHFSVRDPNDLSKEVPDGETGQLVILDPLSRATPGMLLTEDMIYLRKDETFDHRNAQRMQYVMRAPKAKEFGCCAVNLERKMAAEDEDSVCPVAQ
ncbi:LuxE/PaaK family acyltransferase [Vibrio quintilis]|uniref:Phenylacetate-coenzyme A ligase n=1 Tax=Vibrio quintilis TaxID=1117707 RepID=A0A1M7YVM7_9VIBR|nr:LuxE family acyl-protein synthetase [Vibrio quintilis]SHO56621.1 Phenylacetate-coenzyme A ligase [Vibrio quintilis]